MKIVVRSTTEETYYENLRDFLSIEIDGEEVFNVGDGEPEDSNLMRDFKDCKKIPKLLRMAYEAGRRNEPLKIKYEKVDW